MDDFKRHIRGFHRRGGKRGQPHAGGIGGPCSCCVEANKRKRMRLARRRLHDNDLRERNEAEHIESTAQEPIKDTEFCVQNAPEQCMNGNTRSQE